MKITQSKLNQVIKEELREILDLKMLKYHDEEKDWGAKGDRFDTAKLRSQLPLHTVEDVEDDHIEVAIRDAIYDDMDVDEFAESGTLVSGIDNRSTISTVLGNSVEELWKSWEEEN